MVEDDPQTWIKEPAENFLPPHFFYLAISEVLWGAWTSPRDKIFPNIFYSNKCIDGISVDWSKYSTPEDTKYKRTRINEETGVIQFKLENFFNINNIYAFHLSLEHDPIREKKPKYPFINRGHSLIHGITKQFKTQIEREMTDISNWIPQCKPKSLING